MKCTETIAKDAQLGSTTLSRVVKGWYYRVVLQDGTHPTTEVRVDGLILSILGYSVSVDAFVGRLSTSINAPNVLQNPKDFLHCFLTNQLLVTPHAVNKPVYRVLTPLPSIEQSKWDVVYTQVSYRPGLESTSRAEANSCSNNTKTPGLTIQPGSEFCTRQRMLQFQMTALRLGGYIIP